MTNDTREAFEATAWNCSRSRWPDGDYIVSHLQAAWEGYLDGRRSALQEAAKLCEAFSACEDDLDIMASKIRALADEGMKD